MHLNRRELIFGLAASGLCLPQLASAQVQSFGGDAFGSTWRCVAGRGADMAVLVSVIETVIENIDAAMSPYRIASELARFNTIASTNWQAMSPALCEVAQAACDIAHLTQGAFDPTVGPIVGRFGFGPITGGAGDYHDINVRNRTIRKATPDLTLDLCGIAKGYALDRIMDAIADAGIEAGVVEVGGEVRCLAQHPDGRDWQVAIPDPFSTTFQAQRIIAPRNFALATSGHAANGVFGPIPTSHIIDPQTVRPASTALGSVSVLAPTGLRADALATAFCAAGPVAGVRMARDLGIAALFVMGGHGTPSEVMTGSFSNHVLA